MTKFQISKTSLAPYDFCVGKTESIATHVLIHDKPNLLSYYRIELENKRNYDRPNCFLLGSKNREDVERMLIIHTMFVDLGICEK